MEIEFRGKTEFGEWVYGYLTKLYYPRNVLVIGREGTNQDWCNTAFRKVISKTVGQYTGLDDESGVKIYEGDILSGHIGTRNGDIDVVVEAHADLIDGIWFHDNKRGECYDAYKFHMKKVVGNIYDNPELINKEE